MIRGPKGTKVTLRLQKPAGTEESITITRDKVIIEEAYAKGAVLSKKGQKDVGYIHLPVMYMLVILMGASIIKAALIVAYFMHLRFERLNLVLTIVPAVVICICLLLVFFPDSFRAKNLRYQGPPAKAEETH